MLTFTIKKSEIINDIFLPKYYDPDLQSDIASLQSSHELFTIKDLIDNNILEITSGNEIGAISYGTGDIPFVRTSDISNWEIKAIPKQGVSEEIYHKYSDKQDLQPEDILIVKDGSYLIGSNCMIFESDLPFLYQSHIIKIRIVNKQKINPYLLFVLLNSSIVQRQIRRVQFTADIIDTIGSRYIELILPVPKNKKFCDWLSHTAANVLRSREFNKMTIKQFPLLVEDSLLSNSFDPFINYKSLNYESRLSQLIQNTTTQELGKMCHFTIKHSEIINDIFLPKYYNNDVLKILEKLEKSCNVVSIGDLVREKKLELKTGDEIGKMAYGTGEIPFIRTSDFTNWELKADPKQSVSQEIFEEYCVKEDTRGGDILLVRDGSYLIGTTCLITTVDEKMLFCGGIYKIRSLDSSLSPYLLLALLNSYIVKQQIRRKQFTRDVIDTLGRRLEEVLLPIPKDDSLKNAISMFVQEIISSRITDRDVINNLSEIVLLTSEKEQNKIMSNFNYNNAQDII